MNKAYLAAVAAVSIGCAHTSKGVALEVVVASDQAADSIADDWASKTTAAIDKCRAPLSGSATREQRHACLGAYTPENAEKVAAAVKVLIAAQTQVKLAAECEEFKTCVTKPDWFTLAGRVMDAWKTLKPYVLKAKK